MTKHSGVNLRKTHPTLYHSIMTVGTASIALAINFWFSKPTFNPYGINKDIIGAIFLVLGLGKLFFLNVVRDLRLVRIWLATSIGFILFWGASNAEQFFAGKSSLQLPILYVAIAIMQIPLLIEAPVNPTTEKQ